MNSFKPRQGGSVLIVALVILVILTLLGMSGMNNTLMQERMARNMQEALSAFQAAESGLRDGEDDVRLNVIPSTVFKPDCTSGLCEPAATGYDVWATTTLANWDTGARTREFGDATGAADLQAVDRQPAYVIERLKVVERGGSIVTGYQSQPPSEWYRITAKGYGRQGQSEAMVQSVIRR